jgi:hypothetical protein
MIHSEQGYNCLVDVTTEDNGDVLMCSLSCQHAVMRVDRALANHHV